MAPDLEGKFVFLCEFGGSTLCIELPVPSPDDQIKLLSNVSDAFCDFLEELKPEVTALANMVEKGIACMSRLKNKVEAEERQRDAVCHVLTKSDEYPEADVGIALGANSQAESMTESIKLEVKAEVKQDSLCGRRFEKEVRVTPKRRVTFNLETETEQVLAKCKRPHEATQNIAERDPAMACLLQAGGDAVDTDAQDPNSIVPSMSSMPEKAACWPSPLRSAMRAIRLPNLRASHRTRRVCPKPAE
eukprot:TRINITY_DN12737_c2_g1_i1.p1 TRINITY_DN12737_c2_g1~~TRINITY_DN12737_c2_g1_i1.p1  ORF type:complete len:266 (+),score=43.63 TRINITY_DN12737_c2_g1_i1:63-800(+)